MRYPFLACISVCILLLISLLLGAPRTANAQMGAQLDPNAVTWEVTLEPSKGPYTVGDVVKVQFKAKIIAGYNTYSVIQATMGGYGETYLVDESQGLKAKGDLSESPKPKVEWDDLMEDTIRKHLKQVTFTQSFEITAEKASLMGILRYQYCNDQACVYADRPYKFAITAQPNTKGQAVPTDPAPGSGQNTGIDGPEEAIAPARPTKKAPNEGLCNSTPEEIVAGLPAEPLMAQSDTDAGGWGLVGLFFTALAGGLLALFTPCVFPMIPMTVSFFTKRSANRRQGIRNAFLYSFNIIFIYVILGLLLTVTLGSQALYEISVNPWVNLVFFAVLLVFGLSFLGWFEITLPSSWATAVDSKGNAGSFVGIFFMALTLVLVSFSCTGPIAGALLVQAAGGSYLGPTVGMLGFSVAFAVPFGLFAVFPGWLSGLPKSGGWMNAVKVVLGFLELALALKFLSQADLVWSAGILDREVYISAWIVIFALLGVYVLGGIRMPHDSPLKRVNGIRLAVAAASFGLVIFMVPGLWGAPLGVLEGIFPPAKAGQVGALSLYEASSEAAGGLLTGLMSRELALALGVMLSLLAGLWLLGRIRMRLRPADAPLGVLPELPVPRLLGALSALWLGVYLLPGLWGAPLPLASWALPPAHPNTGVRLLAGGCNRPALDVDGRSVCELSRRYDHLAHKAPEGFCAFYDLCEARAYARAVNKPLLLDFTGHTCANCRRMETSVWTQAPIRKRITEDYVLVSLYVDDRTPLPQPIDVAGGKRLRTVGDLWLYTQERLLRTNAQPYYVLTDADLRLLAPAIGYTPDLDAYEAFLRQGTEQFGG